MSWENLKGLARDWLVAIGIVLVLWLLWVRFLAPGALGSGPAPDFTLPDLTGQQVTLSAQPDLVVLNFWFTTCPPCRKEIPELAKFHAAHPDVPLYGVSVDRMDAGRLSALAHKLGVTYPVLHDLDSSVASLYRIGLFPTTVVVHDGQIAAVRTGEVTQASLEALVAEVHSH
jgi:cytochrome c biogenesis protein CcmG/thiol:disulfide interchange protein DsbE